MATAGKVASRVARELMRDVGSRGLVENDRLAAEHDIIDKLKVSRGSVREALRLLEAHGVVELRRGANGGAHLSKPRPEQLASALASLLEWRGGTLGTVIEARAVIEPALAALAARRRQAEHLDALHECVATLRSSTDAEHGDRFHRANRRFHDVVAEAAGNELLTIVMPSLSWMSAAVGWELPLRRRRRTAESKAAIADAIEASDSLAASELMRSIFLVSSGGHRGDDEVLARKIIWADVDELLEAEP